MRCDLSLPCVLISPPLLCASCLSVVCVLLSVKPPPEPRVKGVHVILPYLLMGGADVGQNTTAITHSTMQRQGETEKERRGTIDKGGDEEREERNEK